MSASGSVPLVSNRPEPSFIATSASQGTSLHSGEGESFHHSWLFWSWIGATMIAGSIGVMPEFIQLWSIWTTDPLRSIGMLIFPCSVLLTVAVWRRSGWALQGTWWGLVPIALAFAPVALSRQLVFFWAGGSVHVNFLPSAMPIYLYCGGLILLFAGVRVWAQAWFPLSLLLFLQPVPEIVVRFLDLPMQNLSAHIARSFASLLGLSPTNSELLRLMFAPNFGMFIAPGCDGMRGAITLAYGALILGYLKRVSIAKWIAYVAGALLLGHLFNLIRLCALVLYYRFALGHPEFESFAKQADYIIGGVLFSVAASLFLWLASGKSTQPIGQTVPMTAREGARDRIRASSWKAAVLAALALLAIAPAVRALNRNPETLALAVERGEISGFDLDARMPSTVGAYQRTRAWQEQVAGIPVLEVAAFDLLQSNEIEIGIWLPPSDHSIRRSLLTHGQSPKMTSIVQFIADNGKTASFNTALYEDGITDTFIGDTYCSPTSCQTSSANEDGLHLEVVNVLDHKTRGKRVVPIFFKIEVPHSGDGNELVYRDLAAECRDFIAHLDLSQLSQRFQ